MVLYLAPLCKRRGPRLANDLQTDPKKNPDGEDGHAKNHDIVADGEGFEPPEPLLARLFSKQLL